MENKLRRGLALLMTLIMLISCAPMDALAAIVPVSGGTQTSSGVSLKSIVKPPVATTTYVFMNGTEEFARQIVKNGETLNNPGTPDSGSPNREFTGWRDGDNNAPVFGAVTVTETKEITYHAQFADVYFVFFTNEKGEVMVTKKGKKGDTISTEGVTYPVGNEQTIVGWKDESGKIVTSVTLTDHDVTLTAIVENGHWITYDSQGGTYVAPAFVKGNGTTTAPAAPTRPGYTFHHWSATVGGAAFTFGQQLDQALTLYAVWTANDNTRYTVIHWQENADDDEYSYAESETKTGTTGAQTSAAAKSTAAGTKYNGFTAQTIAQQTIAGDGSTIVNVYYKRNVYDVKFFEEKSGQFPWSPSTWEENTSLRITAKHGANIRAKWPTGTFWYVSQNNQNTAQSNLDTMPIGGKNFYGEASGNGKANYYVEVLPGESGTETVGGKTYKLDHTDTGYTSGTVTDEERYEMTGFTCNVQYSAKNGARYSGSKFYYDRNSYNVVYINSGSQAKVTPYLYQQSIADAGNYQLDNTAAPAGKEGYVFAGWYDAPEGGNEFIFTGKTMPAQNVTVYAKWNLPIVNGKAHIKVDGTDEGTTLTATYGEALNAEELNTLQNAIMDDHPGYTWRGWRTGPNGTGDPFNVDTKIYNNITLYPYYTKDGTFSVTYASGKDGVTAPTDDKKYAEDSYADLMSPDKLVSSDGQYFLGWTDGKNTYQPRDKYQIKGDVTFTGVWGARPAGTTLTYKANGGAGDDVVENLANNETVTTKPADTFSRVGYTFKGWDTDPKGEGSIAPNMQVQVDNNGANVLYAIWTANTDTKYTVEFYYQNVNGTYTLDHSDERTATTDTEVSVTDADKAAKENNKYVFEADNKNNVLSGNVAGNGLLVLKLYFKLNTASYTIHHYLNGTTVPVADDETGTKTIGEKLTANKSDALYLAYAAAEVASYAPSQTITINATGNVITVYYTVPLTITAKSADKTYDGQPLTQPDFKMAGLVNGDTKENFTLSMTAESTITNAGSTQNVINTDTVKYNGVAIPSYYNVSYKPGTLTVNKASATVTITGVNETAVYDGKQHEANGYNYSFTGKPGQITISLKPNVLAIARRTDVGTTYMGLTKDSFTVTSANYDVTIKAVNDGYVTITPVTDKVTVTVTENSGTFTYDGTEHSVKGYKLMTADNTLYDVTKSVKATETAAWTAKGKDAGEYPVGVAAGDFENINKNFTNVAFVIVDGVLKINPITENTITITANSASKTYDGTPLTNNGFTFTKDVLVEGDVLTAVVEGSATNVGDPGVNKVTSYVVMRGDVDVTGNYTFGNSIDGKLTINKRTVTLESKGGSKEYDGTPLTKPDVTVTGDGFVAGEVTDVKATGSVTFVHEGEVTNAITYTTGEKFNADNYTITKNEGKLSITQRTGEGKTITVTAANDEKVYDGTPLTNNGFTHTGVLADGDVLTAVVEGSATNVGDEGKNVVKSYKVMRGDVDVTGNYTFTDSVDGKLTINPRQVTLKSETASKPYDGTPLTKPDVTVGGDGFVAGEVTDVKATGSVTLVDDGVVTNTITYTEGANYKESNYTITKNEGKLSITKREGEGKTITVTANSDEKVYDGAPLTNNGFTHAGALVEGDELTAVVEGSQTDVGSSNNVVKSYRVMRGETDVTNNYTFGDSIIGTLTVTPVAIELTANSASKKYDGTALTDGGYSITKGEFVGEEGLASVTVVGSQTLVGESANTITAHSLKGNTLVQNYTITYKPGKLTVTRNEKVIKVTANSHTWEYDGQPHSDGGYTVNYDGVDYPVAAGEFATLPTGDIVKAKITKTVTNVSDSAAGNNTIDELTIVNAAGEDTKGQYKTVTLIPGTLTITKRGAGEEKVKITAADNTVEYDGSAHGAKLNAAGEIEAGTSYTITNLAEGHSVKTLAIDGSETDAGVYANKLVPGNAVIVDGNGVEVTANYDITYVSGTLTITQRGSGDMKVVLTAANNTVVYDGQPHGVKLNAAGEIEAGTSYTITNLADGHKVQSVVISGSETAVGEYENRLVPSGAKIVDAEDNDVTRNYVVGYKNGKLTITSPDTVIVTIKGKTDTVEYDGQKHEVNGYEVVSISNTLYTEADFGFADGATAHAEGTDAGDYFMNLTKDSFVNRNANFSSVTFVVEDGKLTITRRGLDEENLVKIIAANNSVYYDGQPHGAKLNAAGQIEVNVSYTTEYLAPGHKVQSVVIDGSRTKVGLYKDELVPKSAVIVDKTDKDVTENYEITYVRGTLEIKKNETEIKVTANSHTWEYDGQAHSDGGYTVTYGNESYTVKAGESATLSTGDKVTAVVKGQVKDVDDTKAGNNEIVEWSVEHRDFYNNVTPANGMLTITPRKVTLESDGGSKKYDGTPLTKPNVTGGDGFVAGEVSDVKATGSVTYVSEGEVDNLITFTKKEGFKDSNYEITEKIGKLSIEALDVTIIITGPSAIRKYKPGVTHTIVTGGSELDFVYDSDKVDGKIGVEGMVKGDKILPGTLKHTLEGMYVGEYEGVFTLFDSNGKKADKPTVMHDGVDVTENYKFSYKPGTLTITGDHMDGDKKVENEIPEKNYLLGQKIPFTITVRSVSKDELKDVTVTDPTATILPDRNTANPAYTVSEDEHTATITSLAPEAEVIVYAEHEVTEDDIINRYTNEATINWGNDEVKVSKTPSIEEENPEAELVKEIVLQDGQDENHKFKLGETVYFKITVTNTGNVTLNEYEVKEVLPGAAFIDGTGYTLNNDKTVATIEKMEPVKDGQEAPDSNQIVLYAQYTIKEEDLGNKELKNIVTADNSKPGEVPIPVDEAKSVSGQKIWKDEGNAFNTRPASITLTLMRKLGQNGAAEKYRTMQLGSNDSWRYSFDHLPKHDAQENEYFYWVVEESVTGYDTAYETKDESHCDIVNNLQTYTLTIHYWQHKLGDTKMEQAFPDYVATLYYKQPYDVESPEREGIILDDMSQARISGTMPVHDLVIDVYYHRIAYRLTIHYIYQDGTMAHEDYTWTYWFNSTYNVPSPIIPGFTPSIDVIAGRMPSHGLELTVVYVGDGEIVIPDEDTSLGFKSYLNAGECFE